MIKTKGIFLDLDNTLYSYEECHTFGLKCAFDFFVNQNVFSTYDSFYKSYENAKKQVKIRNKSLASSHSRLLYFKEVLEVQNTFSIKLAIGSTKAYWDGYFSKMKLFDDAVEFLEKYKDKLICIVTDLTCQIQLEKIEALGIEKYIDYIVTSEDAGIEKPHKNIFKLALLKTDLSNQEVVFIGDSYEKDYLGAQSVNIDSYHLNRLGTSLSKNKTISSLSELL